MSSAKSTSTLEDVKINLEGIETETVTSAPPPCEDLSRQQIVKLGGEISLDKNAPFNQVSVTKTKSNAFKLASVKD